MTEGYWIERGKDYVNEFRRHNLLKRAYFKVQQEVLMRVIRKQSFCSVLEVGCGFGRIFRKVLNNFDIDKAVGIDISPHQLMNAKEHIGKRYNYSLVLGEIGGLPFKDKSFDLVLAVEVLMHVPFDRIQTVMAELIRVTRKNIIHCDWYRPSPVSINEKDFAHNYLRVYEVLGIERVKAIDIPRVPFFKERQRVYLVRV